MNALKSSLLIFVALAWGTAWAAPGLINYQGRLTDSSGNPIIAVTNVTFTFWDAETGGGQLGSGFSDTDTVTPDSDGIYSTEIGDDPGSLIPASVFGGDSVWLNVNVGGEDLVPRLRIDSAGFAIHAAHADTATTATNSEALQGLPASAFLHMSADAYVVVKTTSDPTQNGANLLGAYAAARTLTPNGAALSSTNRAVVLVPPGAYNLGTGQVTLDTEFVDLIGLSTAREDQFIYGQSNGPGTGVLAQTANDVRIENLSVKCTRLSGGLSYYETDPAAYFPDSSTTDTVIRNCEFRDDGGGHSWSMRAGITYPGTFTDCTGGDYAFGSFFGTASGTFTNCTGGVISFCGANGTASGTFIDCTGGDYAFGGNGTASGVFTNCTGGDWAFGGEGGWATGTFTNCTGGYSSFGGYWGIVSGTFTNCTGGNEAFGGYYATVSGTFTNCTGGNEAFGGYYATASGSFTNCTGGNYAFGGGTSGTASGTFSGCRMTGTTWTGTWNGVMQDCQWGTGITAGANARIYNSKFLGNVNLSNTTAGIANSYVKGTINNAGSASFNSGNVESPSVN